MRGEREREGVYKCGVGNVEFPAILGAQRVCNCEKVRGSRGRANRFRYGWNEAIVVVVVVRGGAMSTGEDPSIKGAWKDDAALFRAGVAGK